MNKPGLNTCWTSPFAGSFNLENTFAYTRVFLPPGQGTWLPDGRTPMFQGGTAPYLSLPGTNYEMKNRSARAYVQGRFRGEDLVYAEMEYRFPISKCTGVLGGVLFVNGTTTSNRDGGVKIFDYTKAGYGFGLRVAADKSSRTNIAIDVGFGEKSTGIYFGAAEVF